MEFLIIVTALMVVILMAILVINSLFSGTNKPTKPTDKNADESAN